MRRALSTAEKIRRRVMRRRRESDLRARRRASFYTDCLEDVSRDEIAERDNHTCYLCNKWVSVHDSALDHVVPLSKGGGHTRSNVRLTHSTCNSKKGDRLDYRDSSCDEGGDKQQ